MDNDFSKISTCSVNQRLQCKACQDINLNKIYKERINDIIIRGKDHVVVDSYERIHTLDQSPIYYNSKLEYMKPKSYKIEKQSKKDKCSIL